MTKLDEMWVKLAKYQSKADKRGHGESWAEMCRLRTEKACRDADYAAADDDDDAAGAAANAAGYAGYAEAAAASAAAESFFNVDYWTQAAIAHINHAIELAEKQND